MSSVQKRCVLKGFFTPRWDKIHGKKTAQEGPVLASSFWGFGHGGWAPLLWHRGRDSVAETVYLMTGSRETQKGARDKVYPPETCLPWDIVLANVLFVWLVYVNLT